MTDILIIEDNKELGVLLCDFLTAEQYSVHIAGTGEAGISYFLSVGARLVVLDIMLPGMDGFMVCRKLRENGNVPILIVSAKAEKNDKLKGLLLGADDYIEKPYDIELFLAKVGGIFKRRYQNQLLTAGELCLDKPRRTVTRSGQLLQMTAKEFDLLLLLMENSGKVMSKEILFNKIWGFDSFSEPQTLTVHIKWLREKIESDPKKPKHLLTVWGIGYRFDI